MEEIPDYVGVPAGCDACDHIGFRGRVGIYEVLAFDDQGLVKGANRAALKLLGYRDHEAVCGQPVERVLDTSFATLLRLTGHSGYPAEPLGSRLPQRSWFT